MVESLFPTFLTLDGIMWLALANETWVLVTYHFLGEAIEGHSAFCHFFFFLLWQPAPFQKVEPTSQRLATPSAFIPERRQHEAEPPADAHGHGACVGVNLGCLSHCVLGSLCSLCCTAILQHSLSQLINLHFYCLICLLFIPLTSQPFPLPLLCFCLTYLLSNFL